MIQKNLNIKVKEEFIILFFIIIFFIIFFIIYFNYLYFIKLAKLFLKLIHINHLNNIILKVVIIFF